jgi:hypothetical protein
MDLHPPDETDGAHCLVEATLLQDSLHSLQHIVSWDTRDEASGLLDAVMEGRRVRGDGSCGGRGSVERRDRNGVSISRQRVAVRARGGGARGGISAVHQ